MKNALILLAVLAPSPRALKPNKALPLAVLAAQLSERLWHRRELKPKAP
jgi:hypothetical protein